MRLEHLFDGETWYVDEGAWVYGQNHASGYSDGEGRLDGGRVRGEFHWSNRPRRREDGTWLTDMRGFVRTHDGARILLSLRGRSMPDEGPERARDLVCSAIFETSDARYVWLNSVVGIVEGRIDPTSGRMRIRGHECVNELSPSTVGTGGTIDLTASPQSFHATERSGS